MRKCWAAFSVVPPGLSYRSLYDLDFVADQLVEVIDEAVDLRVRDAGGAHGKGKCAAAAKAYSGAGRLGGRGLADGGKLRIVLGRTDEKVGFGGNG